MAMGCVAGSQKVVLPNQNIDLMKKTSEENVKETVLAALARLDDEILNSEKSHPVERLAVVSAELKSIQEEIKMFQATTISTEVNSETYGRTLHQMFMSLDLYRRPMLAIENEDFIANVNRKEMRRIELNWLCNRHKELEKEKGELHAHILRLRSLYGALQQLLDSIWPNNLKVATLSEETLKRSRALCDALASVSARLRAAAEYAHASATSVDDALLAWKLISVGNSGFERTLACADACRMLVRARCYERAARRVMAAYAAPRASRSLRLALDYAFTDALHDQKYQKAAESFTHFKEALVQLINSIHQVLLHTVDNLAAAEREVQKYRKDLRTVRVNDIVKSGLADLSYDCELLGNLKNI